ncbi:MAG: 5-formyltetrahydrofolate cyclo-ligase [Paracoccaceae bacterium]
MSVEKKALRLEMADRRVKAHGVVDPSPALAALIEALKGTNGPISFYWPIRSEIDPRQVMRTIAKMRTVCLPVTEGLGPLTFREWREGTMMETDGFGVQTPDTNASEITPKVLVVPLLAFDSACHRLGYGAGHYDRTIEKLKDTAPILTFGFAYAAQKLETLLPIEPTDQPLDAIITEQGTQIPASSSV